MSSFFMAGLLMEERDIEVRSVDAGMAASAGAARLEAQAAVRHVVGNGIYVALQAQETLLAADQQHTVDAAVRRMAGDAAFDF